MDRRRIQCHSRRHHCGQCGAPRTNAHLASAAQKRVERWRKIGREASQQSRRSAEPRIKEPVDLKSALQQVPIADLRLVLSENERDLSLNSAMSVRSNARVHL